MNMKELHEQIKNTSPMFEPQIKLTHLDFPVYSEMTF